MLCSLASYTTRKKEKKKAASAEILAYFMEQPSYFFEEHIYAIFPGWKQINSEVLAFSKVLCQLQRCNEKQLFQDEFS